MAHFSNHNSPARSTLATLFVFVLVASGCATATSTSPRAPATAISRATTTPTTTPSSSATATIAAARAPTPLARRTPALVTPVRPTVARTVAPTRTARAQRTPTAPAVGPSPTPRSPSIVQVRKSGDQFRLFVNGQPVFLKGMNYNVNYTTLSEDEQIKLHCRDFKIMRDAGVNVVIGWGIYNEITLKVAEEFGIGVIMPFELDPNGSYESEDYRNQIKSDFREYVLRFREFPAVLGWNPGGDELLYRMSTEEHRTVDKLQVAANLELELVQLAYSLDPNHVNVIKEPRDWYLKYLGNALAKAKTQPGDRDLSATLIYGVNVYGHVDDIALALNNAKQTLVGQLGLAMMVSEFGPFDSPATDRAINYADIWDVVAAISTIGGCVYVFGPDQPNHAVANPYDPLTLLPNEYSLVDMHGMPIDGSLAALADKWRQRNTPASFSSATPTDKPK